jgi:hypothetical protein
VQEERRRLTRLPPLGVMDESLIPLEEDYLKRLDFTCSRFQITLDFGGMVFLCRTEDEALRDHILERYRKFTAAEEPSFVIDVRTMDSLDFQTDAATYLTYRRGPHVIGKFRTMAGYFDTETRTGKASMERQSLKQDFENYLRCAMNAAAPVLGGILFHTACIVKEGYGYLFFGPSTAGKSTITRLSSHFTVMTDDMIVLKKRNGTFFAATCGLWGGRTDDFPMIRLEVPVRRFFVIRKDKNNFLKEMSRQSAILEFLCNVPCMARDRSDVQKIMDFAQRATENYTFYELHFHKEDSSFWRTINELDREHSCSKL